MILKSQKLRLLTIALAVHSRCKINGIKIDSCDESMVKEMKSAIIVAGNR